MRLTHYMLRSTIAIWALLCSEDGGLVGRMDRYGRGLLLHLLVLIVVCTPLS